MERKKASDFPQELLSLLDEYVHGGISRRTFLDRAQKFAVGGVTATALFEMLRPNLSERRSLADALDTGRYDSLEFPELLFQRIRRDALSLDLVVVPLRCDIRRRGAERFPGRGINNEALVPVVCEPC